MKKHIKKDLQRRILVWKYERRKMLLKAILCNIEIPFSVRHQAQLLLSKIPRNASRVRIRNRSNINGKGRATFQTYGLDRITFRYWMEMGWIPGCTIDSW